LSSVYAKENVNANYFVK